MDELSAVTPAPLRIVTLHEEGDLGPAQKGFCRQSIAFWASRKASGDTCRVLYGELTMSMGLTIKEIEVPAFSGERQAACDALYLRIFEAVRLGEIGACSTDSTIRRNHFAISRVARGVHKWDLSVERNGDWVMTAFVALTGVRPIQGQVIIEPRKRGSALCLWQVERLWQAELTGVLLASQTLLIEELQERYAGLEVEILP